MAAALVAQPFEEADGAMAHSLAMLRVRVVGWPEDGEEPIVGDPIVDDGMAADRACSAPSRPARYAGAGGRLAASPGIVPAAAAGTRLLRGGALIVRP